MFAIKSILTIIPWDKIGAIVVPLGSEYFKSKGQNKISAEEEIKALRKNLEELAKQHSDLVSATKIVSVRVLIALILASVSIILSVVTLVLNFR